MPWLVEGGKHASVTAGKSLVNNNKVRRDIPWRHVRGDSPQQWNSGKPPLPRVWKHGMFSTHGEGEGGKGRGGWSGSTLLQHYLVKSG